MKTATIEINEGFCTKGNFTINLLYRGKSLMKALMIHNTEINASIERYKIYAKGYGYNKTKVKIFRY